MSNKDNLRTAFQHVSFGFNFWTLAKSKSFHWMLAIVAIIMLFLYSERPWVAVERLGALQAHGYNAAVAELQPRLSEMEEATAEAQVLIRQLEIQKANEKAEAEAALHQLKERQAKEQAEAAQRETDTLRNELAALRHKEAERFAALEQERVQAWQHYQRRQELAKR